MNITKNLKISLFIIALSISCLLLWQSCSKEIISQKGVNETVNPNKKNNARSGNQDPPKIVAKEVGGVITFVMSEAHVKSKLTQEFKRVTGDNHVRIDTIRVVKNVIVAGSTGPTPNDKYFLYGVGINTVNGNSRVITVSLALNPTDSTYFQPYLTGSYTNTCSGNPCSYCIFTSGQGCGCMRDGSCNHTLTCDGEGGASAL